MNFPSLRKVVASTLAASVVLTSASVSSTLFVVNEANAGAATFSSKKPPTTSSEVTSLSALSGTWKIDWESEDAFHESTLIIDKNGSGRMTTTVTFSDESKMTVVQDI